MYTIDSNVNKCHWHSPMRKQLRRALEMLKAICQPFPSPTRMHQKYIYEQDIFMSKIYFWEKYISEQDIFLSKIYIEHKYESWLIVCYIWSHNMDAYALLYFAGHSGSTNLPAARIVLSHISLKSYHRNWIIPFRSHVLIKQPRPYADHLILMTFKF